MWVYKIESSIIFFLRQPQRFVHVLSQTQDERLEEMTIELGSYYERRTQPARSNQNPL